MAKRWEWDKNYERELSKYVRKFNNTITRLEKKTPELKGSGVLPERLNVADVKSSILNKRDYNRVLAKIDRLYKKGAQDIVLDKTTGYYTTNWQKNELKLLEKRINSQRERFIKKYSVPKNQRQFLGLETIDLNRIQKRIFKNAAKQSPEQSENTMQEWYNIIYTLERESSGRYLDANFAKLRNAYFKVIRANLPEDKADELINYLKDNDVWGSDIIFAISQNDALDFEAFYTTEDELARAEVMIDRWREVMPRLKK